MTHTSQTADKVSCQQANAKRRLLTVRNFNILLGIVLACLLMTKAGTKRQPEAGESIRHCEYRLTDKVTIDGLTFFLPPKDTFLTSLILEEGVWEAEETAAAVSLLKPGDVFIDVGAHIG